MAKSIFALWLLSSSVTATVFNSKAELPADVGNKYDFIVVGGKSRCNFCLLLGSKHVLY